MNIHCALNPTPSELGSRSHASRPARTSGYPPSTIHHPPTAAFTMIEIAISLAVIAFALVAIIGLLPRGMDVQKHNRQETIIDQDATILLNAIRNGARGMDDLTNYVLAITNYFTVYSIPGTPQSGHYGYTRTNSEFNNGAMSPPFLLTNGYRIVGLLSTPSTIFLPAQGRSALRFQSNHIVACVRSISGPASEKYPQTNAAVQDLGLSYKVFSTISPWSTNQFAAVWTNYSAQGLATNEMASRSNFMVLARTLQNNLYDIRLTFRWPLLPNGDVPDTGGRQVFRTMIGGQILNTNENGYPANQSNLFFVQPRTYVQVQ